MIKRGLLQTIWTTGQAAKPCTAHMLSATCTRCADCISGLITPRGVYLASPIPLRSHPSDQCVAQTPTDTVLMCTHTHTHTHLYTQLETARRALRAELVGIKLSLFFSPPTEGEGQEESAPVHGRPDRLGCVSRGLKHRSAFPPLSWSWPFSRGPARTAVCGAQKGK